MSICRRGLLVSVCFVNTRPQALFGEWPSPGEARVWQATWLVFEVKCHVAGTTPVLVTDSTFNNIQTCVGDVTNSTMCLPGMCLFCWPFALHILLSQPLHLLTADMHARSHRSDSLHGALSINHPLCRNDLACRHALLSN